MRSKFYLIVFIAVPLLVIGVLFIYQKSKKAPAPPPPQNQDQAAQTPEAQKPELVVASPVVSPILSFDGGTIWYMTPQGKMFRQALNAAPGAPSASQEFPLPQAMGNITKVIWQEKGSDFIIEQNLAGHIRYQFYDTNQSRFTQYPGQTREAAFTSDESHIVYDWVTAGGMHVLKVADKMGQNFRDVANLARADYQIAPSPVKSQAALFADNQVDPGEMLLVDLGTGSTRTVGPRAAFGGVKFSPDGTKLLAARRAPNGRSLLVIVDLGSGASVETGFAADIEMAAWRPDSKAIFAVALGGLTRFDLTSRQTTVLWPDPNLQVRDMLVHPQEPVLFYVDASTSQLYRFSF